ncbi:hypothetical protein AAMO2058_001435900 [Amorphochlora amoebiformis]
MSSPGDNLLEYVDTKNYECLNALKDHGLANALFTPNDEKKHLKSDSDEQLLMTINFNSIVKLKAIKITAPVENGPKSIKIFVNPGSLDFDGAEDEEATQEIELSPEDLGSDAKPKPVKFVRFQKVSCLAIFVPGNQDDEDQTIIEGIKLFGKSTVIAGSKPSKAQQKAASQGDWLNS